MKTYVVKGKITLDYEVEVQADNVDDAVEKVEDNVTYDVTDIEWLIPRDPETESVIEKVPDVKSD